MGLELEVDQVSLTGARQRMQDPVDLFGRHTDALMKAVTGGARSPWGIGVIGMAMDQINETLSEACGHLHANLGETGACIQEMADRGHATELANTAAIQAVGHGLDPSTQQRSV
ncbi:hypothetical protein OG589_12865 [Sphaerisporangium sp. NBC_01403]|uniref:hypothetical protein n=1 Tax=Sphaerisporangium sp. NBC_01403 TaxID=2903599 RepID=UPI00324A3931